MKTLKRKKSPPSRAAAILGDYLKLKAAGKAAKDAGKAVKGTAIVKATKKAPVKPIAIVGAITVAAAGIFAVRRRGNAATAA